MPLYLIGIPWVFNKSLIAAGRHHRPRPRRGADVINACTALRAKGITPFAYGNDTFWTTQLMLQSLD